MPDSLQPAHAHACRQDEQQVACMKYSNAGGDKTQIDEINWFLLLLSQWRPKLSLTHSAKTRRELKANEVNYRVIVGGYSLVWKRLNVRETAVQKSTFIPALTVQ